ncbi:helix-turn-helix transcriptional regulator, partial [Micrococcus luteus]
AEAHAGPADPALLEVALAAPVRRRARDSSEDLVGRLLDIVGLANRAGGVDRAELRARLGITDERLDADLETLRYCGMPERDFPGFQFEVAEVGGRVHVERAADLAGPVRLTRPEAHSLVAALQTVADLPVLDEADREAARSAQRRIRAAVLDAGAPDADDADDAALQEAEAHTAGEPPVAVAAHWDVAVDPATVRTLLAAVAERAVVHLTYRSVHADALTERDVEPLALVQDGARLYLQAWCRRAEDHRVFRVDRISAPAPTGETFAPRARPARWRVHPDDAAGVPVLLRWAHPVRDAAAGYRPDAQADLPDGDRLTRVHLTDAGVAAALVGRHGGAVEVLAPADLRASVADALDDALAALPAR